jgi:serine/threonine protein kinase
MPLAAGTRFGPYEILASIGAGGMGDMYKAHDTRLNRTVAVKIAAEQFSERFEREAHALAALNHPNICTVHDVGPNYLVMEYLEGHPLKGPLPLDQAIAARHSDGWRARRCAPQGDRPSGSEAGQLFWSRRAA